MSNQCSWPSCLRICVLHVKTKPDYIRKEDIIKELQEIEDNLNELEKRGVELEVRLRSCEEGEMNTGSSFVGLSGERTRRYTGRRAYRMTSVCVCVCQREKMTCSWMSSWSSGST